MAEFGDLVVQDGLVAPRTEGKYADSLVFRHGACSMAMDSQSSAVMLRA